MIRSESSLSVSLRSARTPWDWVQFGPFAFQPSFALVYVVYFFAGLGVGAYGLEQGLLGSDGMLARFGLAARSPHSCCGSFLLR